jgi:hypothetical protein
MPTVQDEIFPISNNINFAIFPARDLASSAFAKKETHCGIKVGILGVACHSALRGFDALRENLKKSLPARRAGKEVSRKGGKAQRKWASK